MFASDDKPSILESRNVTVGNRRTSMRLEPQMWDALEDIAQTEATTINNLCAQIDQRRRHIGLTSATRVFVVSYYRQLIRRLQGELVNGGPSLVAWVLDTQIERRFERSPEVPSTDRGKTSGMRWPAEG